MRGFQYKHGDRPLEGFTIQRAAGRGGFGEVYYATSDGGREVALKVLHTFEQIELRGISACQNLKSPHLVTIFDVKYGEDGRPFVIMEFVSGPSLRELIDAAPSGLGPQKSAFFLREIAKGLTYLHDCGIVHRDLKPGNIFYENGYVKIGDYGLSKIISASQNSGQTMTVGTLHYMAPEIGVGRYDKSIDIYALGALLYEMLTGQVPFFGSSPAEILMKHLNTEVQLDGIEEPFKTVIRKAMAKNAADRYQSVQEMVEAVFGAEHVRQSVSHFSPDSLTMVAGKVAQQVAVGVGAGGGGATPGGSSFPHAQRPATPGAFGGRGDRWNMMGDAAQRMGDRLAAMGGRFKCGWPWDSAAAGPEDHAEDAAAQADSLPGKQRRILALIALVITAVATGIAGSVHGDPPWVDALIAFLATGGAAVGIVFARRKLLAGIRQEQGFIKKLAVGGCAAVLALLTSFIVWAPAAQFMFDPLRNWLVIFAAMFFIDWDERANPRREERVSGGKLFSAGLLGFILCMIFSGNPGLVIGIVCGTSLLVQIGSPWIAREARPNDPKRPARWPVPPGTPPAHHPDAPTIAAGAVPPVMGMPADSMHTRMGDMQMQMGPAGMNMQMGGMPMSSDMPLTTMGGRLRRVPTAVRAVWLGCFIVSASLGLMFLIGGGGGAESPIIAIGAGMLMLAVVCLRRATRSCFQSFWGYLFKPLILLGCAQIVMLMVALEDHGPPPMGIVFFTVFSILTFIAIALIPGRTGPARAPAYRPRTVPAPRITTEYQEPLPRRLSNMILTMIGVALLVVGFVVALAVAVDLPGMFASGVPDPKMPQEFARDFGTTEWPRLLRMAGTIPLMIARRRHVAHMLRAVMAAGALMLSAFVLHRALPAWSSIGPLPNPGEAIASFQRQINESRALFAGGWMVASAVLLLWPVKTHIETRAAVLPEVSS
jgi:hypothetical protein